MFKINPNELELLGLTEKERKIIAITSNLAKTTAQIARHAGLPRTTVNYVLKKNDREKVP